MTGRTSRRTVLKALAVAPFVAPLRGNASTFPERTIRIIVPWSAGGVLDVIGRPLADLLSRSLGQAVVLENRPGAQGQVGTAAVAKADPDGHTLLLMNASHVANQLLNSKLPYDAFKDFAPVTQLAISDGSAMAVRKTLPVKDVAEFIALAKANPGKFSFGHPGVSSPMYIAPALFRQVAGIELLPVPYQGTSAYLNDVISGTLDVGFMSTMLAEPNMKNGLVRVLATTGRNRTAGMPDVPTMRELGFPELTLIGYSGLWAPAGTPRDRIERISKAVAEALKSPELRRVVEANGLTLIGSTPEEFADFLAKDFAQQREIMTKIGMKPQ